MFSATFPDDIQTAAQEFLNDYLFLTVGLVGGACSDVEQIFHEVAKFDKREKLEELMQDPARDPKERTLIFVQVLIIFLVSCAMYSVILLFRPRGMLISWPPTCLGKACPPQASTETGCKERGKKLSMISE